jgi:hypothetical protein
MHTVALHAPPSSSAWINFSSCNSEEKRGPNERSPQSTEIDSSPMKRCTSTSRPDIVAASLSESLGMTGFAPPSNTYWSRMFFSLKPCSANDLPLEAKEGFVVCKTWEIL